MSGEESNTINTKALEQELAKALVSLRPFYLKRSSIREDSKTGVDDFSVAHSAILQKWPFAPKKHVAVKKYRTAGDRDQLLRLALALARELDVWAKLNHPNILPFTGFHLSAGLEEAWLVSPYAKNGNVLKYIERTQPQMGARLQLAKDTAKGLQYLHTRTPPICHGNIKPSNILIGVSGHAMLGDLRPAKATDTSAVSTNSNPTDRDTIRYRSPELLFHDNGYSTLAADVWAWGCVLLEVITGQSPYHEVVLEEQLADAISEKKLPAALSDISCPTHIRDLLALCWKIEADSRPSTSQLLARLIAGNALFYRPQSLSSESSVTPTHLDYMEQELTGMLEPLEQYRIDPSWLKFPEDGKRIGDGGYAVVDKAIMRPNLQSHEVVVAVKKLRANGGRRRRLQIVIALIREVAVWVTLSHPCVIAFTGFYLSPQYGEAWLVAPLMANGTLDQYLQSSKIDAVERSKLALDTARGLEYLHGLKPPICHGDIKSYNFLITNDYHAILFDFGLSKVMESIPSGLMTTSFNQAGTLPYESPELLLGTTLRSLESDVWAWGCVLQEIFSGKHPYYWANNPGAIVKWITEGIPPAIVDAISWPALIRNLAIYCWRLRPAFRPTIARCVAVLSNPAIDPDMVHKALDVPQKQLTIHPISPGGSTLELDNDMEVGSATEVWSGSLGILFTARTSATAPVIVVKEIFRSKDDEAVSHLLFMLQAKMDRWKTLFHPNVISTSGYTQSETGSGLGIFLVSPYSPNGNIVDYIKGHSPAYDQKKKLAMNVAEGIFYLHSRSPPMCHGSLHPGNILIDDNRGAIICDYDMDEIVGNLEEHDVPGSFRYRSPESLTKKAKPTIHGDIWSWGSVFLQPALPALKSFAQIIADQVPYRQFVDEMSLVTALHQRITPASIDELDCSPRVQNILRQCWKWEPELRSNLSNVTPILSGSLCKFTSAWSIDAVWFSYDGKYLMVGFSGEGFRIYHTETGAMAYDIPLSGPQYLWAQMSRSGQSLVISNYDKTVSLYDIETKELQATFQNHSNNVRVFDISPDDAYIISASYDRTIRKWYPARREGNGKILRSTKQQILSLAISPTAEVVAVSTAGQCNELLDASTGETKALLERPEDTWTLRFTPDGKRLYGGCHDGSVCYWDVGDLLPAEGKHDEVRSLPYHEIKGAQESIISVSASKSWMVSVSDDGDVRAMKVESLGTSTESIGNVGRIQD
ncbi:hypothetical protein FRB99_004604, partial [Tulasnella sp. 403]